jgi:hypothetical protein
MISSLPPNNSKVVPINFRYGPALCNSDLVPNFVFGISLASAEVNKDWVLTQTLLSCTLRSVLAQTDTRFMIFICGHECPNVPEMQDSRVTFFECDIPPPKKTSEYRKDKMYKRRLLGLALARLGGGYFFPLDADDLVHKDVVAFSLNDDNRSGYLVDQGYVLDVANQKIANVKNVWETDFNYVCGSSAAIYFNKDELPSSGLDTDPKLYFNLFQSHAYWPNVAREYGRPFKRFPFPAGVYAVNHSQNLSFNLQRSGARASNIVEAVAGHHIEKSKHMLSAEFGQTSLEISGYSNMVSHVK